MGACISLSISQRAGGKWKKVDLGQFRNIHELALTVEGMDGEECVAEWRNGEAKAFACGSEKQAKAYQDKGERVMTFSALVQGLKTKDYLERILVMSRHPGVQEALKVFKGAVLSQVELDENREHRVAYMIDKDVTEEQAHQWCDTKPEEFGTRGGQYEHKDVGGRVGQRGWVQPEQG